MGKKSAQFRGFWLAAAVISVSLLALAQIAVGGTASAAEPVAAYAERLPQDEVIYFMLPDRFANGNSANDRGGLRGDRLHTGFDPTTKGFYHGGDLAGLTRHLDYIAGLGVTTIWVGPVFGNKPVQGPPGQESAGYHGYWIEDFTNIDPHFGTRDDFRRFVDAAHARGIKVYLDIVVNHTADVIQYRECPNAFDCPFRSRADYPYTRQGGVDGAAINDGFLGDGAGQQTAENFARLTDPNYAYHVYVPAAETHVKKPDWLNNPIYYHNRGNFSSNTASFTQGDFSGLDDLFTENPRVLQGFIDIYGKWIDDFAIDGFRIDTERHVNPEFWHAFVPAMIARARARGVPHFHIFGEVFDFDVANLALHTRVDGIPSVLDFALQSAATDVIARGAGTDRLARVFAADPDYEGGAEAALALPTFLGNHDMGRFANLVLYFNPHISDDELLKRVTLGYALLMLARGAPVIYYGDEQGFTGDGGDQDAREDMFASRVASYNDNRMVGSHGSTATDNYNTQAPLYRTIAALAALRTGNPALRRGQQVTRAFGQGPGLFAFSRLLDGVEILVALNTGATPITAQVDVESGSRDWRSLHGDCASASSAPGSYRVSVAPLDYVVCVSGASR
ncbi:MAG: alpha-amylase family glycosyl hydrolase [Terricaulis silvestris]